MRSLKPTITDVRRRDAAAFRPASRRGFTLVELMVTIAVAAILLTIAVPSFTTIVNSNRLTTAANTMVGALNTARMEAIKRNASTQFCSDNGTTGNNSDTLGTACGSNGGAVAVLVVAGGATTATQVLQSASGLTPPLQLHGSITAIRFTTQGLGYQATASTSAPYSGTVADICTTALSSNNHIVISMAAGSVVSTATSSTGTCP